MGWVALGCNDYAKRLPQECRLMLKHISGSKASKTMPRRVVQECDHLHAAIPKNAIVVAPDWRGIWLNTEYLTDTLRQWMQTAQDVFRSISAADRSSENYWRCTDIHWPLFELTFSHALVRAMIAEQLYPARSMFWKHPNHQA